MYSQCENFLKRCIACFPEYYEGNTTNHLTLMYFTLGSLQLLGKDGGMTDDDRVKMKEYIYAQQCVTGGFEGGPLGAGKYRRSSVANTYVALAMLRMLGDDLAGVNRDALLGELRTLQMEDGNFLSALIDGEAGESGDLRFVYSACAISYMLKDWSGIDKEKAIEFILACQNLDGAFGQLPCLESHGGSTYCALAALALMGALDRLERKKDLICWLVMKQTTGFCGRVNKIPDACYAFWVGASLKILGVYDHVVNKNALIGFMDSCQSSKGGFAKYPKVYPDILHTYCSLAGLSLCGVPDIAPLDPLINVPLSVKEFMDAN